MDDILKAIAKVIEIIFSRPENVALMVSVTFNVALAWAHVVWRREERQDREKSVETFGEVVEAINRLTNVISANTGRAIS